MGLLELASIAAQYSTEIAHATMQAVAVAVSQGSLFGWLESALPPSSEKAGPPEEAPRTLRGKGGRGQFPNARGRRARGEG